MIIVPNPQDKVYAQPNQGDFAGNIKQTKNIDFFSKKGYIKLAHRTRNLGDSSTLTSLTTNNYEYIIKIVFAFSYLWIMGSKTLYKFDGKTATIDSSTNTPALTDIGDMCVFVNPTATYLCVANNNSGIYYLETASSTWVSLSLSIANAECLCVFDNLVALAVGSGYQIQLVDSTLAASTILNLPQQYAIKSMAWNNNLLYIAVLNTKGGDGGIFTWDGQSALANNFFPIKGNITAITRYGIGAAFITTQGQLMYIDSAPKVLASFPIYYTNKFWEPDVNYVLTGGEDKVLNGGLVVDKELIYVAVNADYLTNWNSHDSTQDYFENDFPSGVWCYDPSVGLHHKYSLGPSLMTNSGAITTSNVDTSTSVITLPSSICPATGTPVFYDDASSTDISPLVEATRYFVINLSGTTMQLATTYANAIAGTYIPLTSTGNSSQSFNFCPNDDFGGIRQIPRALYVSNLPNGSVVPANYVDTHLVIGSFIAKTADSYVNTGIHAVETKQENRGYFLLTRQYTSKPTTFGILIPTIQGAYPKCFIKFQPLVNPEDAIVVKWRKVKTPLVQNKLFGSVITGTWVTSTTFTTPNITGMSVGYEIEIVNGAGSGYLAHITNISSISGGVYTITIDETIQNITASQTFQYTVDNWTKIPIIITTAYSTNNDGFAELPIAAKGTAIELKVELRGIDVAIEEIQVISEPYKESA